MNKFLSSYVETALWSSTDGASDPLDNKYSASNIAPEAIERMRLDCEQFQTKYPEVLHTHNLEALPMDDIQVAHDFWLTRNHHGAGFWDGDYPKAIGEALTELAHSFGECDLYVGDDGKLYLA